MSMHVRELTAQVAAGLDLPGPGDDHRVTRPAQVARHLLAPLERRIAGVGPRRGVVRGGVEAAQRLDAAELLDDLQLLVGLEHDAVEEGRLVEGAREGALHARAVVAPDVDDQRVVEVAHLLDLVEQPSDVPVGVLGEAREHLHLAGVELLLGVTERVPGRIQLGALRQLRVLRDDAELLLALEGLLAVRVPAAVELALVLVGPFLRDVVRRVAAAGRVVHEPRLLRVLRADGMKPLDGLVGEVVREVVERAVLAVLHAQSRVVLGDDRVVLAGRAGQEAPPVVEAPAQRPVVERPGGAHLATRREVPFPEPAGDVAVLLQDARQRRAAPRPRPGVAGERPRELRDPAHSHPMVVAAGEQRSAGRRAHRRHVEPVVGQAHLLHAREVRRADPAAEGVRGAEAGVVDQDEEDVRRAVGRLRAGDHRPVAHGLVDRAAGRPAEVPVGNREHRAVRGELAHRLREGILERAHPLLVAVHDRPEQRARERLLDAEPLPVVEDGDDAGRARRQVLADLVVHLRLDPVVDELAGDAARRGAHRRRRQQRRREEAHGNADPAAPAHALAAQVVARLLYRDAAVLGVSDEDHSLDLDLLCLDEPDERLEIGCCRVDVLVAGYEDIRWCICHHCLLWSATASACRGW